MSASLMPGSDDSSLARVAPCTFNRFPCVGAPSRPGRVGPDSTSGRRLGTGRGDNYAYVVVDDASRDAVVIDPANPDE